MSEGRCGRRCCVNLQVGTLAATATSPRDELAAAGRRAGDRGKTPAPAALCAAHERMAWPALGSHFVRLLPCGRDLKVFCALCPYPLSSTFYLATTSLFSSRAGWVSPRRRDKCKPLSTRPPSAQFFFLVILRFLLCGRAVGGSSPRLSLRVLATRS